MNFRGGNRRQLFYRRPGNPNNFDMRALPNKRKYEDEESATSNKRPSYQQSSYPHDDFMNRGSYFPQGAQQFQYEESANTNVNVGKQRYSANNRLQKIRIDIEEQKKNIASTGQDQPDLQENSSPELNNRIRRTQSLQQFQYKKSANTNVNVNKQRYSANDRLQKIWNSIVIKKSATSTGQHQSDLQKNPSPEFPQNFHQPDLQKPSPEFPQNFHQPDLQKKPSPKFQQNFHPLDLQRKPSPECPQDFHQPDLQKRPSPKFPRNFHQPDLEKRPSPQDFHQPDLQKKPSPKFPRNFHQPDVQKKPSPDFPQDFHQPDLQKKPSPKFPRNFHQPDLQENPQYSNIQIQVSPKTKQSFVVTARPSSLKERLENIRNSNNSMNEQNQIETPKNTATTNYQENKNKSTSSQDNSNVSSRYSPPHRISPQGISMDIRPLSNNNIMPSLPFNVNTGETPGAVTPVERRNSYTDDTFMDWSYIEEREVLLNIQELRKEAVVNNDVTPHTPFQEVIAKNAPDIPKNKGVLKDIYIIVDTNIFISNLSVIKELLDVKVNGVVYPIILIPWMVIQELDYIKDGRSDNKLKSRAQAAVRFIHDNLFKNSRIKGQSIREAARQDFSSTNSDDGILYCCMQISRKCNRAMLLSNDINLRNKAEVNGIASYSHSQIIYALDPFRTEQRFSSSEENKKIQQLQSCLSQLLNDIMLKELEETYGIGWCGIRKTIKNQPWTLQDCIELLQRFWQTVFSASLQKQCLVKIDKLNEFLNKYKDSGTTIVEVEKFIELCLGLCVYFKNGFSKYIAKIEECINSIQNIADTESDTVSKS